MRRRHVGVTENEQIEAVIERLKAAVGRCSTRSRTQTDPDASWPVPFRLLSLVQASVLQELELPLYDCDIPHCASIRRLAEHIVCELVPPPVPGRFTGALYEPERWAWDLPAHAPANTSAAIVFLLSAPRSGSTLLRAMLAGHPSLFSPPELHLLPFQTMSRRREQTEALGYDWMRRGLVSALMGDGCGLLGALQKASTLERDASPIGTVYALLAERGRGRMLVDKTPTYAFHPDWASAADALFPNARFIHLVREPRATIQSFVRMRFHRLFGPHWLVWDANGWRYAEKCWTACHLHICQLLDRLDASRHRLVRYEDLVANPAGELQRVCEFLGVSFEPAMLTPYAGERQLHDQSTGSAALGDPNFLNHDRVEPARRQSGPSTLPTFELADLTREVAGRLQVSAA